MRLQISLAAGIALFMAHNSPVLGQTNTFPASGNVGIGTTSPQSALDVTGGDLLLSGGSPKVSSHKGEIWYDGSALHLYAYDAGGLFFHAAGGGASPTTQMFLNSLGQLGIGTTSPQSALDVTGGNLLLSGGAAVQTLHKGQVWYDGSALHLYAYDAGGIYFHSAGGGASPSTQMILDSSGKLHFADGTIQSTAWTGVLCGGDYAEAVETEGSKALYGPGDVLVISASSDKDVQKSREPYSTGVAGIYATKPGMVGKRESLANASDDIPMAMVGIVPTKVSAENGPIRRGDLLVTSSRAGYAMRGTDRTKMLGAVIGKAMGTLDSGSGVIEVLVTLQ